MFVCSVPSRCAASAEGREAAAGEGSRCAWRVSILSVASLMDRSWTMDIHRENRGATHVRGLGCLMLPCVCSFFDVCKVTSYIVYVYWMMSLNSLNEKETNDNMNRNSTIQTKQIVHANVTPFSRTQQGGRIASFSANPISRGLHPTAKD